MAACNGCEAGSFSFSYLGLPIGSNMSRIANWQILIDHFKARLSGWKANLLSIGGRLTLIKSVLGNLGIYYFSILRPLKWLLSLLKACALIFFWGGHESSNKLSWVKWSNTLASFDKSCLGVGSLSAFNEALLLKWKWRLFNFLNSLWVQEWVWCRPITMGISKTEFDNLIIDISNMEIDDLVESDTCVWSLSNDDSFSVNSVRKHFDEHSLPSLFSCTRWYKMIPKKTLIRFLAWFVMGMLNRMTTSFSLVTRLLQFGILFDHGLICLCQAFSRVKIGPTGLIHGMLLRTKRPVCIPSLLLLVALFGVLGTISHSTLIL
nr:RNA-directed DNA polymerase, eukaryota, reverse transcriptase zinc-binding domain protein [Tanacetum cinerariifolium]